mmetsp:Transcript_23457/g.54690  ORF Transcript_23457/g.54690 Transcript_23457/m.54690 type:complete len:221 (-) Transcript_23457:202-864(-)
MPTTDGLLILVLLLLTDRNELRLVFADEVALLPLMADDLFGSAVPITHLLEVLEGHGVVLGIQMIRELWRPDRFHFLLVLGAHLGLFLDDDHLFVEALSDVLLLDDHVMPEFSVDGQAGGHLNLAIQDSLIELVDVSLSICSILQQTWHDVHVQDLSDFPHLRPLCGRQAHLSPSLDEFLHLLQHHGARSLLLARTFRADRRAQLRLDFCVGVGVAAGLH